MFYFEKLCREKGGEKSSLVPSTGPPSPVTSPRCHIPRISPSCAWPQAQSVLSPSPGSCLSASGSPESLCQLARWRPAWQQLRRTQAGRGWSGFCLGDLGQVHDPSGPQHLHPSVKGLGPQSPGAAWWGMRWGGEGEQRGLRSSHLLQPEAQPSVTPRTVLQQNGLK